MTDRGSTVSTQVIHCTDMRGRKVEALLVVFEDGTVEVHCDGKCTTEECNYGMKV